MCYSIKKAKNTRVFTSCVFAIALLATITLTPPASAQLFDGPVDRLPVKERVALREGRVLVTGNKGQYTGRFLVKSLTATAWEVLTDYDNFERFLPNVVASQILEINGNRKVFEQVQIIRAFIFRKKVSVRIAVTQTYPQQIAFSVVEGLEALDGAWRLESVSPHPGASPNQVLITHQVTVDPGSTPSRDLFFRVYKDNLEDTLAAIKQEIEQRAANK